MKFLRGNLSTFYWDEEKKYIVVAGPSSPHRAHNVKQGRQILWNFFFFLHTLFATLYFAKLNIRIEGPREYKRLKYIVQPWGSCVPTSWHFNVSLFWVKEKHFWMVVLHGGSNREEITGFAVKRLNVPLLATVTVMPHTTTRASLSTYTLTRHDGDVTC